MDEATGETAVRTGARLPRQGEAFWREMVVAWTASGLGTRRFCRERGLAVSTFGLLRKKLSGEARAEVRPLELTPDAAVIVSHPDTTPAIQAPPSTVDTPSSSSDRVTLLLSGVCWSNSSDHGEQTPSSKIID
jgi:hypothetical protein